MQKTFYLVTTLIEMCECVSDSHTLCSTIEKAEKAFKEEIKTSRENFFGRSGEFIIDMWGCQEWRTEDGYGYTVSIEEVEPK